MGTLDDAADAAIDTWVASLSPISADPVAVRDAMRPLARALLSMVGNRATASVASNITTTSSTYATILTANITTELAAGYVDVSFTSSFARPSTLGTAYFQVLIDDVVAKGAYVTLGAGYGGSAAISLRAAVTAGAHTVKVQWKTDSGTLQCLASTVVTEHAHVLVQESA